MAQYKDNLLGEANSFLEVLEQVSRLAPLDKPVLVIGERGTGKELIANRLHYLSARWQGPIITLNCAALNDAMPALVFNLACSTGYPSHHGVMNRVTTGAEGGAGQASFASDDHEGDAPLSPIVVS